MAYFCDFLLAAKRFLRFSWNLATVKNKSTYGRIRSIAVGRSIIFCHFGTNFYFYQVRFVVPFYVANKSLLIYILPINCGVFFSYQANNELSSPRPRTRRDHPRAQVHRSTCGRCSQSHNSFNCWLTDLAQKNVTSSD